MKYSKVLILGFFALSLSTNAQKINFKKDKYWVEAGVGGYGSAKSSGFSEEISANLIIDSTLFKIRYLNSSEFNIFGPLPEEEYSNFAAMLGKGFSGKYAQIYFSAGLGLTTGVERGKYLYTKQGNNSLGLDDKIYYEEKKLITPSIPLEVDILLKPSKYIGPGLTFFGDLNYKTPYYGILVKVALGKLS